MVHYKLIYFDMPGRAEPMRILFAQAGVAFEDARFPREDWPRIKPTTPFGQVPVLEVDGHPIAQSLAILRFLGRQFKLAGATELEEARVDMFADQVNDFTVEIRQFFAVAMGRAEGDKDQLFQDVFVPAKEKLFKLLTRNLAGKDFITDSITWGDVYIASMLSTAAEMIPDVFDGYPELEAYVKRVMSAPRIKAYLAKRSSK